MRTYKRSPILRFLATLLFITAVAGCEDDCNGNGNGGENEDFPDGSVWRFEMHYEETGLKGFLPGGGCPYHEGWVCEGQKLYGDPIYMDIVMDFGGEFRVEPELFAGADFRYLVPLDVFASMRATLPERKYKRTYSEPYGTIMHSGGQHSVNEVFHAADVLEWFGEDNDLREGQFGISIDPPYDTWEVYGYSWTLSSNTQPGRVSGIGSRWSSDSHPLTEVWGPYWEAPLESGQWTEEVGPDDFTDGGGFTYLGFHSTSTLSLHCIENCKNFDCSEPCYDGKDCTDDTCVDGIGCTFEPRTGTCSDNECFEEGTCVDGECVQEVERDCDDNDTCTKDDCHPLHGCTHDADNKKLRNEDPTDCWQVICLNGLEQTVPDPTETPPQGPDDDCWKNICVAGMGEVAVPDNTETPPQGPPDDCLREACLAELGLVSVPDATEPGCQCTRDLECEDGNFCTRESCDMATNTCIMHGPDDSLIPPEIPANCNDEQCEGGAVVLEPDSGDTPVDLDPYDCMQQWCDNGVIETAPDEDEHIGCTEPP